MPDAAGPMAGGPAPKEQSSSADRQRQGESPQPMGPGPSLMGVRLLQRAVGNRQVNALLAAAAPMTGGLLQRVAINYADQGETLYEDPPSPGKTAGSNRFTPTSYSGGRIKYDLTRGASDATVKVRIRFVDQKRSEKKATLGQDVGKISQIKDQARMDFAKARCQAISAVWDHYDLVGGATTGKGASAKTQEVRLKLNFIAEPVFDLKSKVHAEIRLYGMGVVAKRDGAHPIDSGHWYMDTQTNYAGMNADRIAAHEYGHLFGLQDEYSRSNDQMHQMMHRMGGGAKNSDRDLDRYSARQMVLAALMDPITAELNTELGKIGPTLVMCKDDLKFDLARTMRSVWDDPVLSTFAADTIRPEVKKSALRWTVLPAVAMAALGAGGLKQAAAATNANFTVPAIQSAASTAVKTWTQRAQFEGVTVTGADGLDTRIFAEFSDNVKKAGTTGANAPKGAAAAKGVVGTGPLGLPAVKPSPTLLEELKGLPKHWASLSDPFGGLLGPDVIRPKLQAALDSAIAAKAFEKVNDFSALSSAVKNVINTAAEQSALAAVDTFLSSSVAPKITAQLDRLRTLVENEVDVSMGTPAAAMAAKSQDPNLAALANQMVGIVKSQQNAKSWDKKGDINPGEGTAKRDVRYSATSIMGADPEDDSGFRGGDMLGPLVTQFNKNLKKANESAFNAEVAR